VKKLKLVNYAKKKLKLNPVDNNFNPKRKCLTARSLRSNR